MKRAVLLSLFISVIVAVKAQSVTFITEDVDLWGRNSKSEYEGNVGIVNNSSDISDTTFSWRFINYNIPSAWEIDLCDPFECKYGVSASKTDVFNLTKGEEGLFYAKFHPKSTAGFGSLTVIVTSVKDSNNADTVTISLNAWATAVKEVKTAKTISFYPNPVKDQLTLKFEANQDIKVDIYNILGVKVKTFTHDGTNTQVGVSDLQNGVYFIRFNENGKAYTKQFVKTQ